MTANIDEIRHLRWQCRRGLLELDVLLGNFLEQQYLSLPTTQQAIFVRLLSCADQDLLTWFMRTAQPEDMELQQMVELVLSIGVKS